MTENSQLDELIIEGERSRTISGDLPLRQQGFHWQAATSKVSRVAHSRGEMAHGIVDGKEIARGEVIDIHYDGKLAELWMEPPYPFFVGESDERDTNRY